ncbi:MAG: cache domain-containing protein [Azoarcus sp.]|nr:cache domain-containing protein [Azoarcus sp.]
MSLKQRLLVLVATLLVTVIVVLSATAYWQMRTEVISIIHQEIKTTAQGNYGVMANWVMQRRNVIEAVAARLPLVEDPVPFLLEGKNVGSFDQTFVGYNDKRIIYDLVDKKPTPNFDPTERLWYKQADEAQDTIITQPYISVRTKELCITVARPVASRIPGVVAGDISLGEIIQFVNAIELRGLGYAFLSTRGGKIVAHSKYNSALKPVAEVMPGFDASILETVGDIIALHEFNIEGIPKYIAASPIPGADWVLCLVVDKTAALSPLRSLLWKQVLTGLAVAAAGILIAHLALSKSLTLSPESCRTEGESR